MSRPLPQNLFATAPIPHQGPLDAHAPWSNPWAVCWRRRKLMLAVTLLGTMATLLFWKTRPGSYLSSAQLILIAGVGNNSHADSPSAREARIDSHIQQLKSPLIINRVVKKVFEASFPEEDELQASKRLKLECKGNLLKISYSAPTKEKSQAQLSEIISGYQGYLRYTPQSNHTEAINEIRNKISQEEARLANTQETYTQLLKPTPFAGTNKSVLDQIDHRLEQLTEKRQAALLRKSELEQQIAAQAPAGSLPNSLQQDLVTPGLRQTAARELYDRELRERLISERARGDRPELRRASRETSQARELYQNIGEQSDLKLQLQELEKTISALDGLLLAEKQSSAHWSNVANRASRLRTEMGHLSQAIGTLNRQLQSRQLSAELEACQLQIIAPPKPGVPRSTKQVMLYYLLPGILGSVVLAVGCGCYVEFNDRGFHSPCEIPRSIGAPLLGVIPFLTQEEAKSEHSAISELVANYRISTSSFADQFRKIRSAIVQATPKNRGVTLLLTSHSREVGRSVCAANLAAVLAQAGRRILLIDTCFQTPQLHRIFEVSNQTGLADILAHSTAWQNLVQPTLLADVDLLTSGKATGSSGELLSSPQWLEFLESVKRYYDYLIIDGPGLQESPVSLVLAGCADYVYMLLSVGRNSRYEAQQLLEHLGPESERVSGVIMNNVKNVKAIWSTDPFEDYRRLHMLTPNPNTGARRQAETPPSVTTSSATEKLQSSSGAMGNNGPSNQAIEEEGIRAPKMVNPHRSASTAEADSQVLGMLNPNSRG